MKCLATAIALPAVAAALHAAIAATIDLDGVEAPGSCNQSAPGGPLSPNLTLGNVSVSGDVIMNGKAGGFGP